MDHTDDRTAIEVHLRVGNFTFYTGAELDQSFLAI